MAHGDYTGQRKASLAQKYAEEQALASQNMTLVSEIVREGQNETISLMTERDYENLRTRTRRNDDDELEVVEVDQPDPQFREVKFRASEDLEQVTVGQGREFNLLSGRTYTAPHWVVQHLDAQGVVWH